jgi:hypothetical protein
VTEIGFDWCSREVVVSAVGVVMMRREEVEVRGSREGLIEARKEGEMERGEESLWQELLFG